MLSYDLCPLRTKKQLLDYLDIDEIFFQRVCGFDPDEHDKSITEEHTIIEIPPFWRHEIPKKNRNRGTRTVWEAESHLNNIYKALATRLALFFQKALPGFPHDRCFGYVRDRNIRGNAELHIGKKS